MAIFDIKDLSFKYAGKSENAISNISLTVNEGDFVIVAGASGCGKTTLLRFLKNELSPNGAKQGEVLFDGIDITKRVDKESVFDVGFVMQNVETQIVTDKVWHELAFGLENKGLANEEIRSLVGETASYFGLQDIFHSKTEELSGGQKQLLCLASIMATRPRVLVLDEPTAQLDPIAGQEFLSRIIKLNKELGLTIIIAEHNLEEIFASATTVVMMENGKITSKGAPREVGECLRARANDKMIESLPCAVRVYDYLKNAGDICQQECPLDIAEGRRFLKAILGKEQEKKLDISTTGRQFHQKEKNNEVAEIAVKGLWFRYDKDKQDILKDTSIEVKKSEIFTIVGGNGTGKTTLLKVVSGQIKAYKGEICIRGKKLQHYKYNELYKKGLTFLPQNPQEVFLRDTLEDDLLDMLKIVGVDKAEREPMIDKILSRFGLENCRKANAADLSGGEQQRAAIAKLMLLQPKIMLLDEPTKGLDSSAMSELVKILLSLKAEGVTILIVTHNLEFGAKVSDRVALMFDGQLIAQADTQEFFGQNSYYTTASRRLSRGICGECISDKQIVDEVNKRLEQKK